MDFKKRIGIQEKSSGAGGEHYFCYIPQPLPLKPPLAMEHLYPLLEEASQSLGRFDAIIDILPEPHIFLFHYLKKEAVLSSQIEGTQSSLFDLLYWESEKKPRGNQDVREISSCLEAMSHGLRSRLPLCSRLLCEIHKKLIQTDRHTPGRYRTSQNWIGGTRPWKRSLRASPSP